MVSSPPHELLCFDYDHKILEDSHTILQSRRKRRNFDSPPSRALPFEHLVGLHRYVCFFFVQGSGSYYSIHSLGLRRHLATHYHDSMTTFVVSLNDGEDGDGFFCQGTGFLVFPFSPILMTLFNITQTPTIKIVDTATGRALTTDAGLAMEWNDPHYVINAWQRGRSGLSVGQKTLAMITCQSDCVIL